MSLTYGGKSPARIIYGRKDVRKIIYGGKTVWQTPGIKLFLKLNQYVPIPAGYTEIRSANADSPWWYNIGRYTHLRIYYNNSSKSYMVEQDRLEGGKVALHAELCSYSTFKDNVTHVLIR